MLVVGGGGGGSFAPTLLPVKKTVIKVPARAKPPVIQATLVAASF